MELNLNLNLISSVFDSSAAIPPHPDLPTPRRREPRIASRRGFPTARQDPPNLEDLSLSLGRFSSAPAPRPSRPDQRAEVPIRTRRTRGADLPLTPGPEIPFLLRAPRSETQPVNNASRECSGVHLN